jgi:hypothetical protein
VREQRPCRLRQVSGVAVFAKRTEDTLENVALNKLSLFGSLGELVLELLERLLVDGRLAGVARTGRCGR